MTWWEHVWESLVELWHLEPAGLLAAGGSVIVAGALMLLLMVGVARRWFAGFTAEVLVRKAGSAALAGRACKGLEHEKRLLRLYAAAGEGDPGQWNRFMQELSLLERGVGEVPEALEIQILSDAAGREIAAHLEQRNDVARRKEIFKAYRNLFTDLLKQ